MFHIAIEKLAKLFVVGIILSVSCPKAVFASNPMIPQHLLLRLLSNPLSYKGEVKLSLDRLPENIPVEIPSIEQARVAASVSYDEQEFYIFLDIPDSPQNIQTIYRNILRGKGWLQLPINEEDIFSRLGFNDGFNPHFTESITFCHQKQNASLILTTPPSENSITKPTLKLELNPLNYSCQAEWEDKAWIQNILMPILIQPPKTEITKNIESGGSDNNYNTTAIITTELDRQTLFDRYYSQMEQMGWKKIASAEEDLLCFSLWDLKDSDKNNWRGFIKWTKIEQNSDKYLVDFQVIEQSWIDRGIKAAIQSIPLNDRQISRELADRILENVPEINNKRAFLLVGQLPNNLPLELPLPNNTQIVGSSVKEDYFEILLEIPQSPARIEQFYRQQLTSADWKKYEGNFNNVPNNGFISSGYKPFEMNIFCNFKNGWELYLNTHPSRENSTDLRLRIRKSNPNSVCLSSLNPEIQKHNEQSKNITEIVLKQFSPPLLTAPEKAQVFPGRSGMNSRGDRDGNYSLVEYTSSIAIYTQLNIQEIANYYFSQMPKYGWETRSEIKQDSIAVGMWTFKNDRNSYFQASIDIIKNQNIPQQYAANLTIIPTEDLE